MSRRASPDIGVLAVGGVIAAAGAVAICLVLAALAKPEQLKARIARLDQMAQRTDALAAKPGDPAAYPLQAVCNNTGGGGGEDLKRRVAALASLAGVTVSNIDAAEGPSDRSGDLTPIKLQLTVNGHYDSVLLMLDALSKSRPVFFVDRLDLKSETANVDLKIAGNIYCWTSDHP